MKTAITGYRLINRQVVRGVFIHRVFFSHN